MTNNANDQDAELTQCKDVYRSGLALVHFASIMLHLLIIFCDLFARRFAAAARIGDANQLSIARHRNRLRAAAAFDFFHVVPAFAQPFDDLRRQALFIRNNIRPPLVMKPAVLHGIRQRLIEIEHAHNRQQQPA